MGFVIGVVVVLLVIFLLAYITVKKPVFGELMIGISVLMILVSTFFYFQKDNRAENKKNLIPNEQIELSEITHHLAYGNFYKITALLKNNSQHYQLRVLVLDIKFFKCKTSSDTMNDNNLQNCTLVSTKQHEIKTRLAAQQVANIESYILLDDDALAEASDLNWQIKIADGIAR